VGQQVEESCQEWQWKEATVSTVAVVVLGDGETFTTAEGCSIVIITRDQLEEVSSGIEKISDITPILEIGLTEYRY